MMRSTYDHCLMSSPPAYQPHLEPRRSGTMMGDQEAELATAGGWLLGTDSAAEGGDTTLHSGPDGQTGATLVHQPEPGLVPVVDGRAAVRRPSGSRDLCRLYDRQSELEEFQRVFSRPRETPSGAIIVEG